jgi:hypothetical protein
VDLTRRVGVDWSRFSRTRAPHPAPSEESTIWRQARGFGFYLVAIQKGEHVDFIKTLGAPADRLKAAN